MMPVVWLCLVKQVCAFGQARHQMTIIQPSASDVEQGGPPGIPMRLLIQLVRAQTASLAHHSAAKVARVSI